MTARYPVTQKNAATGDVTHSWLEIPITTEGADRLRAAQAAAKAAAKSNATSEPTEVGKS